MSFKRVLNPASRLRMLIAALPVVVAGATPAFAQAPKFERTSGLGLVQAWRDCAPDRRRLCSNVLPGGGRVVRCLMDNRDALSPACRSHTAKVDLVSNAAKSCRADTERFCSNILPGGGRLVSCLVGNLDRLTPDCRGDLQDAREALRN